MTILSSACKSRRRRAGRILLSCLCLAALVLAAGCHGRVTSAERRSREQLSSVAGTYRPGGRKPSLPALGPEATLADLLQYALLNQPAVEAAYDDWAASVERITTARSLPDPQLTFQTDIRDIVTSLMPGLMMAFPGAGKLRAAAAVASEESQARYFAFRSAALDVAYEVKSLCYQLANVDAKLRVNGENLGLLADLEKLARAENEVGKVTLQDVLRAQIEQDGLKTEISNLEDSRGPLMARLKAALGLDQAAPDPPLPRRLESTPIELPPEELLQTVLRTNTQLKALEAEVKAAEAGIEMARKSRNPDASLGLMADVKMSPTLYRPTGSISLPLWRDKLAAQLAEAQANRRAAQARLSAAQINLVADFAATSYLYRESSRNLALLQGQLLPKSRQSLALARSGYLSGQIDFFNLIDAERTWLGFELDALDASTQRELALAELSLLAQGKPSASAAMPGGARGPGANKAAGRAGRPGSMTTMR